MTETPKLEHTYRVGLLADERVAEWEADLLRIRANVLPSDVLSWRILNVNAGDTLTANITNVALTLISDRRALLNRIAALEAAVGDAQLDAAIAATDLTRLSDSVGHA